uniref:Coiled-coil domain-containing protein 130 homolog n=1 Tax=Parastrongyloides trichosuri TaxID=131310 RepID=A0A0N4ZWN9_PARTI
MGERKGQNKYYPPDFDYKKHKTLNAYHGTTALRDRGKKMSQGIIIIRFEMPYNIWCAGCDSHVGMGVRFNAEKRKVGNYYTTPIYEFDMKCMYCDGHYVIRTDPKNFDYEIVSGARRQQIRRLRNKDEMEEETEGKNDDLVYDKMKKLQHLHNDISSSKVVTETVTKLERYNERMKDDYRINSLARDIFRKEKKDTNEMIKKEEGWKHSLGIGHITLPAAKEIDQIKANAIVKTQDILNAYTKTNSSSTNKKDLLLKKIAMNSQRTNNTSLKRPLEDKKLINISKIIKKDSTITKSTNDNPLVVYSSDSE